MWCLEAWKGRPLRKARASSTVSLPVIGRRMICSPVAPPRVPLADAHGRLEGHSLNEGRAVVEPQVVPAVWLDGVDALDRLLGQRVGHPDPDQVQRLVFFFKATATTEIYTLSLHDALPI